MVNPQLLRVAVGVAMTAGAGSAAGSGAAQPPALRAVRAENNPVLTPETMFGPGAKPTNINGPSLIRAPSWLPKPLGKYYLYFADHGGKAIQLAFADDLRGPWKVHPGGTLLLAQAPGCRGHIASPDVHVDDERKEIRMYFHGPAAAGGGQKSFLALSREGLAFIAGEKPIGPFYFRVFQYDGWFYAVAKDGNVGGVLLRSRDGRSDFQPGPKFIPHLRHTAVKVQGDTLVLFFSLIGDAPESIKVTRIDLRQDWTKWEAAMSPPVVLLKPEKDWEGASLPVKPSRPGPAMRVNQLRDPCYFAEAGKEYLLYTVAGECGIALAELLPSAD